MRRTPSGEPAAGRLRRRGACSGERRAAAPPRTFHETPCSGLSPAGRNDAARGSSVDAPAPVRRRAPRSARGDAATAAHSTLSADTTHIRVFYPFHPLHGYSLRVTRRPKRGDGAVSVIDPTGRRLKIPVWMICSDAAEIRVSDQAHLSRDALLKLASLIARPTGAGIHDNLLQTSVDGRKGGNHAAATALEPDPNRRGTRAGRRAGTSRTRQSHGPHSGDCVSNGGKENR